MVGLEDFKDWKYSCIVTKGRFRGKQVVPLLGAPSTKVTGTIRATDEEFAKKKARTNVISRYKDVIHIVNLIVEEVK